MDQERFNKLKEALHKINSDSSLTEEQKAKLRQGLFSNPSVPKNPEPEQNDSLEPSYHDAQKTIFGCPHYKRDAKIVAKCCNRVFTCRFCHDEACDHKIIRFDTEEMICMHCLIRQPIQQFCRSSICKERKLGTYYCHICKFLDNAGRNIYHCPGCGICRVGKGLGIDYFHCTPCNLCFPNNGNHQCPGVDVRDRVCPVCLEDLFQSRDPVHPLRCNHLMHSKCYEQHRKSPFAICPICSKSLDPPPNFRRINADNRDSQTTEERVVTQNRVEGSSEIPTTTTTTEAPGQNDQPPVGSGTDGGSQRRTNINRIVLPRRNVNSAYLEMFFARSLPMPQEYRHIKAKILCNDCLQHTMTRYHFYGSWCDSCGSWNTRLISTDPPLSSLSPASNPSSSNSQPTSPQPSQNSPLTDPTIQNQSNQTQNETEEENSVIQLVFTDGGPDAEFQLEIAYENDSAPQGEDVPSLSLAQLVEGYLGGEQVEGEDEDEEDDVDFDDDDEDDDDDDVREEMESEVEDQADNDQEQRQDQGGDLDELD